MYSHNGLLFQANYTSGLRVFDIDGNDLNPSEVAFFDTAPTSSAASFNGLWSCYPYFSGTIIGSDIERGLFVLSRTASSWTSSAGRRPWWIPTASRSPWT